jgi:diacylglycerol kinase family enzyme
MRVALIFNDDAGDGRYTEEELVGLLRDEDHDVVVFDKKDEDIARAIDSRPNAIVASGGDGTIARVAIALCGNDVPMYILPTGTANNIARAVGADAPIPVAISNLAKARSSSLDIGELCGNPGEKRFVEAAGFGFIGAMLGQGMAPLRRFVSAVRQLHDPAPDWWQRVARDVARIIRKQPSRFLHIDADGVDLSGEYAAVKVMNIGAIGPRIPIARDANPGDGAFDLVLVRPDEQDALADFVAGVPGAEPYPGTSRRVQRVTLDWPETDTHVDDEVWPAPGEPRPTRVTIRPHGVVHLLVAAS